MSRSKGVQMARFSRALVGGLLLAAAGGGLTLEGCSSSSNGNPGTGGQPGGGVGGKAPGTGGVGGSTVIPGTGGVAAPGGHGGSAPAGSAGGSAAGGAGGITPGAGGDSAPGGTAGTTAAGGTGAPGGAVGGGGTTATGGTAGAGVGGATSNGGSAGTGGVTLPVATINVVTISATGPDRFYGVTYDAQGNIYATGQAATTTDSTADIATVVAKFTPAGVLDTSFGTSGFVIRNMAVGTNGELFRGIAVQSSGKIVVSGSMEHPGSADPRDRDIGVARFNADGTKDTTFGADGLATLDLSTGVVNGSSFSADSAWGLAVYPDDRLVVSGGQVRTAAMDTDFVLLRLTANGLRDATFGANGLFSLDTLLDGTTTSNNASPRNVTILPGTDGLIGAGYQPVPGADTRPVLYKVTDAGVLDPTFGTSGVFSQAALAEQTETYQAVVQPGPSGTYKLVTTGYGRALASETTDLVSLRLTSNGVLDPSYGTNGLVRIDIGGFADNSRRLVVLPDSRILLVGGGRLTSSDVDGMVAILTPNGQPDTTFSATGWKPYNLGGPADFF
ncbi:MAG TPA: hypothetical protein VGP07_24290, partial [Polyangia bacterium]